jgi:hypothetical protein
MALFAQLWHLLSIYQTSIKTIILVVVLMVAIVENIA